MLNQELKNKIAPWQEKGRWYHALIESDGSAYTLTECDLEGCSMYGSGIFKMAAKFQPIDFKITDVDLYPSKTINSHTRKTAADGSFYLTLPSVGDFSYCNIWFFGYFTE